MAAEAIECYLESLQKGPLPESDVAGAASAHPDHGVPGERCTDGAGQGMHCACAAFTVDRTLAANHHRAMCGRFLLNSPLVELQRALRFPERPNLEPRYNVAPTQTVPIARLRKDREGRELALAAGAWWRSGPRISRSGAR